MAQTATLIIERRLNRRNRSIGDRIEGLNRTFLRAVSPL